MIFPAVRAPFEFFAKAPFVYFIERNEIPKVDLLSAAKFQVIERSEIPRID
jgi:hypothetical protein